jgi:hypothetical protein
VFRSRKFRRSCTVLQLLGRDEGPVSSKREFGFFLEIRFLALIWRLISTSYLRWAAKGRGFSEELNFFHLWREGFARFPVVGLGNDPGLFLPVALSGKFNVCSTTDCSYYVNSAGSIQCTVKGSPPRIKVCIKENLCAARFEWYRSQPRIR